MSSNVISPTNLKYRSRLVIFIGFFTIPRCIAEKHYLTYILNHHELEEEQGDSNI